MCKIRISPLFLLRSGGRPLRQPSDLQGPSVRREGRADAAVDFMPVAATELNSKRAPPAFPGSYSLHTRSRIYIRSHRQHRVSCYRAHEKLYSYSCTSARVLTTSLRQSPLWLNSSELSMELYSRVIIKSLSAVKVHKVLK